jgi:hypothetical protein
VTHRILEASSGDFRCLEHFKGDSQKIHRNPWEIPQMSDFRNLQKPREAVTGHLSCLLRAGEVMTSSLPLPKLSQLQPSHMIILESYHEIQRVIQTNIFLCNVKENKEGIEGDN